ncbi:hypothetical protein TNCV_1553981 [Trichonephila clavipes]|nr:hypothetical protein TNCV_1553981 [Trichonephila clavipes]
MGNENLDSDCRKPLILLDIAGMRSNGIALESRVLIFIPYRYLTCRRILAKIRSTENCIGYCILRHCGHFVKWWANCTFSISDAIRHSMKIQMQCTALKKKRNGYSIANEFNRILQ